MGGKKDYRDRNLFPLHLHRFTYMDRCLMEIKDSCLKWKILSSVDCSQYKKVSTTDQIQTTLFENTDQIQNKILTAKFWPHKMGLTNLCQVTRRLVCHSEGLVVDMHTSVAHVCQEGVSSKCLPRVLGSGMGSPRSQNSMYDCIYQ